MRKKLAAMLLAAVMVVGLLSLSACGGTGETSGTDGSESPKQSDTPEITKPPETAYVPEGEVVASGEAGESVTWALYSDGTLVISGTGPMEDYVGPYRLMLAGADVKQPQWYKDRNNITKAVIENGVTSIGTFTFDEYSSLTSVSIPNSVTSIGDGAFYGCTGLTSVTIPNSVISIGLGAFVDCRSLTSVTIPNSVTSIGDSAFGRTPWLEGLGEFAIVNGILLAYQGHGGDVVIPNGVTSIGNNAFYDRGLTSVTIPDSVTSIGDGAFNEHYFHGFGGVLVFSLTNVYYGGSESQWGQIVIGDDNVPLLNATIHYNS